LLRDPHAQADGQAAAALVRRRALREPMAHILGRREFWSLDLAVSPATLIPRPETETLIEAAIASRPDRGSVRRVLDLGTGTGCLLLAALTEFPDATGIGIDRSAEAAALARGNARALGLSDRAAFACGDWAAAIGGRFDLVLCNPPYVAREEMAALAPEIRLYEPRTALEAGQDGLDAYRLIIADLPRLISDEGMAVIELGAEQANAVAAIAQREKFVIALRSDLAGIPRAVLLSPGCRCKKPFGTGGKGD
jgi:release factor glutamine methyltransferase